MRSGGAEIDAFDMITGKEAAGKAQELMLDIEGGSFQMGSEEDRHSSPVHSVTVSSFQMMKTEVPQWLYLAVMGEAKREIRTEGDNLPIDFITWDEAVKFCNKLSLLAGLTPCYSGSGKGTSCDFNANGYRLPTEAEWEYAALGGKNNSSYKYSGSDSIDDVAWYRKNSQYRAKEVATKAPNALGLYDMSGNAWEWCWDICKGSDSDYNGIKTKKDPTGIDTNEETPSSGDAYWRVLRGGSSYVEYPDYCTVWYREYSYQNERPSNGQYGFRLVRSVR